MKNSIDRRQFMKKIAKGGAVGALGSLGQLSMMSEAVAASPSFGDGYKALVCVFMYGGNDGFNMLIPSDGLHADYQTSRAALAVQKNDLGLSSISNALHNGTMGGGDANLYNIDLQHTSAYTKGFYDLSSKGINLGVNGVMPEFAQLVMDDKLSIIANSGNMVAPVTRDQVLNGTANLPLFLFAHNHQQRELQTGRADSIADIGWAGQVADSWVGINNNSPFGLNVSYSGNDRLLIGRNTSPLVLSPRLPPSFVNMRKDNSSYETQRRTLFKDLINLGKSSSPFKQLTAGLLDHSITSYESLSTAWAENPINYATKGPYGEDLFASPSAAQLGFGAGVGTSFISRMNYVAKMIDLGARDAFATGNYKRQIFFVGVGGYDSHNNQSASHSIRLRDMSLGLWKFQKAMEELGHAEKVTTFSMSDFGRTLSINGGLGTDHAWGSHHFVMGGTGAKTAGSLNGGSMMGTAPSLKIGGVDDSGNKGRIIPTTSQDQVNATVCKWFGVDEALISNIFPNLSNFETNPGVASSAYLNNLFVS